MLLPVLSRAKHNVKQINCVSSARAETVWLEKPLATLLASQL